jgi:hypothetical protein
MADDFDLHIGRLKDGWRLEFRETRAQITRLQARLNELKAKLDNADEILAAAKGKKRSVGKYSEMGVAEAVRTFFAEHRFSPHSISDVMRRLQHEGLKSSAQNLRDIISITCRRLQKEDNFLASELRDGVRFFWVRNKIELLKNEQAGTSKPVPAVRSVSKQ